MTVSSFGTLYRLANERIWSSRALRGWTVTLWSIFAVILTAEIWGYYHLEVVYFIATWSFVLIFLLTPVFMATWVHRTHVSAGSLDEHLRILPIHPISIFIPRLTAVLLAWIQFFAPFLLVVIIYPGFVMFTPFSGLISTVKLVCVSLQILGWVLIWATWGFLIGSVIMKRGGSFILAYFLPAIMAVTLVALFAHFSLMYLTVWLIFRGYLFLPIWLQMIGYAGLILSPLFLLSGSLAWGRGK